MRWRRCAWLGAAVVGSLISSRLLPSAGNPPLASLAAPFPRGFPNDPETPRDSDLASLPSEICGSRPRLCTPSDAQLLDRHGRLVHERRLDPTRRRLAWTPLSAISPALVAAVIASEDRRFWRHGGVDLFALVSAAASHLTGEGRRGASTITMQLASLLDAEGAGGRPRSLGAKWAQIRGSWDLESRWPKDSILEAYLNLATFRGELQGVSAASAVLFDKAPHGVDETEALVLAASLRSPNASAPLLAKRAARLAAVLSVDPTAIPAVVERALTDPRGHGPRPTLAPHVAAQLLTADRGADPVRSTLDADIQRFAAETLRRHLLALSDSHARDGAVLVIDNPSGDVLAYVGSSGDLASARHVDGVRARRQAGSTLKPLLYGLAIDQRLLTAASLLEDAPLEIPVAGGLYRPQNYDERFRGLVSVRTALAASINIPAVRTLELLGADRFVHQLRRLGFHSLTQSADYYGPSLALGSADVSLWELAGAYRALARGGDWSPLRLRASDPPAASVSTYSPATAFVISSILADRDSRSGTFGLDNPLATRFWSAVKTGTSKDMRDNWCIGYSSRYTVAVWVGNFSGRPMRDVSGVSGAAPVWADIITWLHREESSPPPTEPGGVSSTPVAFPDDREPARTEWFLSGTDPQGVRPLSRDLPRISSPAPGTRIALDPDMPPDRQRLSLEATAAPDGARWVMDREDLGSAAVARLWAPAPGTHRLSLVDASGRVLHAIEFSVRGSWLPEQVDGPQKG